MIKWLNNLKSDIGQPQHSQLWHYTEILDVIARYLESTERPKGEWVRHELWDVPWFTCSECNFHGRNDYKFCPMCGADMRGDKEC